MVTTNNYFNNPNVALIAKEGSASVYEFQKHYTTSPQLAEILYYCDLNGVKRKQVVMELNNSSCILSSGAMQWTAGNIEAQTDLKGVGDLLGKMVKGAATGEGAVKPKYSGSGIVVLEPTYKYIILQKVEDWAGGMVLDDGMFLACEGTVEQKMARRSNLSSALMSGEGIFNLCLTGRGVAVLESPVPPEELVEINLQDDTIKVDGNFAVAWSNTLKFTTERSSKSLIGSTATGEGLVNVFRGTGKILLAPVR